MEKIFKIALVGCGSIATVHLKSIAALPHVKVIALCDINPEKAEGHKVKYGLDATVYESFDKMLECETLDAIHITTPHYLHAPMTIAALKKDINVFLEKPICISNEEISELLDAEAKSNAKVCVCFQNRFNPSTLIAKKIASEDGGVKSAFGSIFWNRNAAYYTESGWRGSYATEGGGVMINQAIHTIDLLCEFIGTPDTVTATIANHHLKDVIEVEDTCEGIIKFTNGKKANFYTTTSFDGKDTTLIFLFTEHHIIEIRHMDIIVDGVKVDVKNLENNSSSDGDERSAKGFFGKDCYGNGHPYTIKKFYECLASGEEMPVTLANSQYALKILLAAYKSNDNEIKIQ